MTCVAATLCAGGEGDAPVQDGKGRLTWGGAKGTRTPNPLLAKQVRYQLRHGPWVASHASRPGRQPTVPGAGGDDGHDEQRLEHRGLLRTTRGGGPKRT